MLSGVFDLRGAESYLTVRRAPRSEKTPLGAVHRRPQQAIGEICGLGRREAVWCLLPSGRQGALHRKSPGRGHDHRNLDDG